MYLTFDFNDSIFINVGKILDNFNGLIDRDVFNQMFLIKKDLDVLNDFLENSDVCFSHCFFDCLGYEIDDDDLSLIEFNTGIDKDRLISINNIYLRGLEKIEKTLERMEAFDNNFHLITFDY